VKKRAVILLGLLAALQLGAQDIFELASRGTPGQIQAARDAGTNVNVQDEKGRTPLMYAASDNTDPAVAAALLKGQGSKTGTARACPRSCGRPPIIGTRT
jgi:hypothetical protein